MKYKRIYTPFVLAQFAIKYGKMKFKTSSRYSIICQLSFVLGFSPEELSENVAEI